MWWTEDADEIARVARYWEARVARPAERDPLVMALDPVLCDMIDALHAQDDARLPDPAFVARVEQTLMQTIAATPGLTLSRVLPPSPADRVIATPEPPPLSARRMPWPWSGTGISAVTAAALVLLVLSLGLGAQRLATPRDGQPASRPALLATPPAVPQVESLLTVTIPVAELPPGETFGWLTEFTLAPEATVTMPPWRAGARTSFEYVVAGREQAVSSAPGWVVRAGSPLTSTPTRAGETVILAPGDALVLTPPRDPAARQERRRNLGATPLVLLTGGVAAAGGAGPAQPVGVTSRDVGFVAPGQLAALSGPLVITLQRLRLAPGVRVPPPTVGKWIFGPDDPGWEAATATRIDLRLTFVGAGAGAATPAG